MTSIPEDYEYGSSTYQGDVSRTRKLEGAQRMMHEKHQTILRQVQMLELAMGIQRRWQPADPQYIETARHIAERKYRRALDELQRLVVQRLFELNTMNIAGTGDFRALVNVNFIY